MNNVNQLYNKYFDTYKKNCDSEDLNEDKFFFDPTSLKHLVRKNKNQSRLKKILRKTQKPLWFEINRNEFEESTRDICNNQDKNDFKITINKRIYDLKNAKKYWMDVTTRKITKSEAKELYNKLIEKDIDALEREKSNNDTRKHNILNILNNVVSIFIGLYWH